jgi:hypothetical protein
MVLNVKQYKHCNFYLGRGARDFIILLVLGQSNGPLPKKNHKNICVLGCTTTNLIH